MTDTLVSTREVPWMKLGKIADEAMTAQEAAKAGGLDFEVKKWIVQGVDPDNPSETITVGERSMLVRKDNKQWLGIMSKDYPILQYSEAFDFMDTVNPKYVAAGALKSGKQGFMVVKAPETITVLDGEDPHELFMVLRTSHDGSRAIEITCMPLRFKCMNQLALQSFAAGAKHRWSVKHTASMHKKLADAEASLKKLGAYAKQFENTAHRLTKIKVDDDQAKKILTAVLPDRPKREAHIERIITTWHQSDTVGFDYTGWGLLNAVSEDFDWGRSGGNPESRFIGALQGSTRTALNKTAARLLQSA